jgi:hypothetical protein
MLLCKRRYVIRQFMFSFISVLIIAMGFLRNVILSGTFKGGNTKEVSTGIQDVMDTFLTSAFHLFLGSETLRRDVFPPGILESTLLLTMAVVVALIIRSKANIMDRVSSVFWNGPCLLLTLFTIIYIGSMIYLGTCTVISFGERLFLPILPVVFLLSALLLAAKEGLLGGLCKYRTPFVLAIVTLAVCYSLINLRSSLREEPSFPHNLVEARLTKPLPDGTPLMSWIDTHIPPDAVLVAADGQATAHVLKRKTLSLVGSHFSNQAWTEKRIRDLMLSYNSEFLILYPEAQDTKQRARESRFIKGLLDGASFSWISMAITNKDVTIFRLS